jgi:hypothetical protein
MVDIVQNNVHVYWKIHSLPSSANVKNKWNSTSKVFLGGLCLLGVHRRNFCRLIPRWHKISQAPCNFSLFINIIFFVILTDLLTTKWFFNNYIPQSLHCLLLYPLNTTHFLSNRPLCTLTPHLPGRQLRRLLSSDWSDNKSVFLSKFLEIRLNLRGRKTSTTLPKVANLFTGINHILCKHNAKQNFQISSSREA